MNDGVREAAKHAHGWDELVDTDVSNTSARLRETRSAIRDGYAWPGGYPLYLVMADGGSLCVKCGRSEYRNISWSTRHNPRDGWGIAGIDVNWDGELDCDHCGERIESAYGEAEGA